MICAALHFRHRRVLLLLHRLVCAMLHWRWPVLVFHGRWSPSSIECLFIGCRRGFALCGGRVGRLVRILRRNIWGYRGYGRPACGHLLLVVSNDKENSSNNESNKGNASDRSTSYRRNRSG